MQIISAILFALAAIGIVYRFRWFDIPSLPRWSSPVILSLKFFFGLLLLAVYTFYYTDRSTGDIYKYFDDAKIIHNAQSSNCQAWRALMAGNEDTSLRGLYTSKMKNWERNFSTAAPFNENRFMIRLNALLMVCWGENILMNTLFFGLLSWFGTMLLLIVWVRYSSPAKIPWLILTLVLPSFLFWTSGGLKESIMVCAIGLVIYGLVSINRRFWISLFALLFGSALLLLTRYQLLLCIMPAALAYFLIPSRTSFFALAAKYVSVLILSLLLVGLLGPINKHTDLARILAKKQRKAVAEALYLNAGSYSEVPELEPNMKSIVANAPIGLWNSLMKPYIWQSRNPLMLLSALENLFLLIVFLAAIFLFDKRHLPDYNFLLMLLTTAILYFSLIGLISPVLGNLVRYKVVLSPFILFVCFSLIDFQKLQFYKRT